MNDLENVYYRKCEVFLKSMTNVDLMQSTWLKNYIGYNVHNICMKATNCFEFQGILAHR